MADDSLIANAGGMSTAPPLSPEDFNAALNKTQMNEQIPTQDSALPNQLTPPDQPQQPIQLPPRPIGTGVASQPRPSKAEFFRQMLGDFMYSVGKGLQAQKPGEPNAGAGAALTALPERNMMQAQIAIQRQQAESEASLREAQAQKAREEAQSVPVTLSNGQQVFLPASIAKQILTAQAAGQSRERVQGQKSDTAETIAGENIASKEKITGENIQSREKIAATNAANKPDNEISLIKKANAGDKEAKAALDTLMANRKEVAAMRTSNIAKEVVAYDEDGTPYTKYVTAADAIKQGLSSAPQGAKNLSKIKQIEDIEFSSKKLREAVNGMDKPFSPEQIAKLQVALQSNDEGVVKTQIGALANDALTSKQQDFVLWVKHINERALSLRNIAGQGQGAQDTRNAIRALLPGAATGNTQMMNKMMDAFDNQVAILKSGIPRAGGAPRGPKASGKQYSPDNPFGK